MDTNLNSLTQLKLTPGLLALFFPVLGQLSRAMLDSVNAGNVYSGPVPTWLVDTRLNCHRCDDVTEASCAVAIWVQFRQQLSEGKFKCGCGGELTDGPALIKLPPLTKAPQPITLQNGGATRFTKTTP